MPKTFKNYELKSYILKSIKNSPTTVDFLYKGLISQKDYDYHNFTSEMAHLKRRGYIAFLDAKTPHRYVLTPKGEIHAENPYLPRDEFRKRMMELMQKSLRNSEALNTYLQKFAPPMPAPPVTIVQPDLQTVQQLQEAQAKIASLEQEVDDLKAKNALKVEKKVEKVDLARQRKKDMDEKQKMRRALAAEYIRNGGLLDLNFFMRWTVVRPWWIKDINMSEHYIEIISGSNDEIRRGHATQPLTDEEIKIERMVIKSKTPYVERLLVGGKTMENHHLTW